MKNYLVFLALTFVLAGCKKNDEVEIELNEPYKIGGKYLIEESCSGGSGQSTRQLEFNITSVDSLGFSLEFGEDEWSDSFELIGVDSTREEYKPQNQNNSSEILEYFPENDSIFFVIVYNTGFFSKICFYRGTGTK